MLVYGEIKQILMRTGVKEERRETKKLKNYYPRTKNKTLEVKWIPILIIPMNTALEHKISWVQLILGQIRI